MKRNIIEKKNENFLAKFTYRRLSQPTAIFFAKLGLTPNQVSFLSIILSAAAGLFFSFGKWKHLAIGFLFLQLTYFLDHVDGDIARYTKKSSDFGHWVDTFSNKFHKFFFLLGLSIGLFRNSGNASYLLLGSVSIFLWFFAAYISETKNNVKTHRKEKEKMDGIRSLPFALIVNNVFGFLVLFNLPAPALWFICIVSLNAFQQILSIRRKSI